MKFGLIGWAIASGNGGMNYDIASLAPWVGHWLVPDHPSASNHLPYLSGPASSKIITCKLEGDDLVYEAFLDNIDGLIYVEYPCLRKQYDIVARAKELGKYVVGIPMWEWWPEQTPWALQTNLLWAVTKFTNRYLNALSEVLFAHGWKHDWRGKVFGSTWGVNLSEFPYQQRNRVENFTFINGNGGYKLRKASDIVFSAFSDPSAPPLTIYTQQTEMLDRSIPPNARLHHHTFPMRSDVYQFGDVFLFPSYWEGLCHGLYECQASGGIAITTDFPPMNECGTDLLLPVKAYEQVTLGSKSVAKAVTSAEDLLALSKELYGKDVSLLSLDARLRMEKSHNLEFVLKRLYATILEHV